MSNVREYPKRERKEEETTKITPPYSM